jgi:hypothetical protein
MGGHIHYHCFLTEGHKTNTHVIVRLVMLTYLNCRRSSEAKLGHVAGGHSLRDRPMRELAWDLKNKLTHTHTCTHTHAPVGLSVFFAWRFHVGHCTY